MTDQKEIEQLIAQALARGARIRALRDETGAIGYVWVLDGVPGCGRRCMAPIRAAEVLREFLATAPEGAGP